MTSRLLVLHLRGRQAGRVACALLGVAVACWALVVFVDDTGMLVPVLAPLAAVSVLGFALGGADPALERVTPQRWARWRAAELAVCATVAALALLPAGEHLDAALRNLAGLGGLAAIGLVALGPRLAWLVPSAWAFVGAAVGPGAAAWLAPLTWPVEPGGSGLGYAAALAAAGVLLHTRYGAATPAPSGA